VQGKHLLVFLGLLAVMGCGGGSGGKRAAGDTLSERQRDTAISKSGIPGARGVGRAMSVADSTSAQVRSTDTIQ